MIDWKHITIPTYIRWVCTFLICINGFLNMVNINPLNVSNSPYYNVVSNILTIGVLIVNTYKNNSTSTIAISHDKKMREEKKKMKTKR